MQKLTHEELLNRQAQNQSPEKLPFIVLLNDIRSLQNVGSVFRTADAVGIEKLWLCGITGIPPSTKISKTALDAEKVVPWEYAESATECAKNLKSQGYEIVLLEQTDQSIPYQDFKPQGPICLVVGNEITGVSDDLVAFGDRAVEIEMTGLKNSLNVTVALGVVAYHIRRELVIPT